MNPIFSPFTIPDAEEITADDLLEQMERTDRWVCILVLLSLVPIAVAMGVHLYFTCFR